MIHRVRLGSFKRFRDQSFELDDAVVLAGPNNSGKSTLLQAIATWKFGLDHWLAQREGGSRGVRRTGVALTRKDFTAVPRGILHARCGPIRNETEPSRLRRSSGAPPNVMAGYRQHYESARSVLRQTLPRLGEGKDGFKPPF